MAGRVTSHRRDWIAAGALVGGIGLASLFLGMFPMVVIVPVLFLGWWGLAIPPVLFWVWTYRLWRGDGGIPARSLIGLALLTLLTPVWFGANWSYGLTFQGHSFLLTSLVLNVLMASLTWRLFWQARRATSTRPSVVFHVALFGWLSLCALPALGELP